MRRPRAGDDNGDDRYGVRVDEPTRHLSSPLLPSSFSPPFSFFFFLLPFFSFLLSFLLFLLPPPPSYSGRAGARARRALGRGARARGPGSRRGGRAGSRRLRRGGSGDDGAAAPARRRGGYGARVCACLVCAWCVLCPVFLYFKPLCLVPDPGHSAKKLFCRVPPIWHSVK